MDSSKVRARQRKAGRRLRSTATAHARRLFQSYRNRRWRSIRATATGTLQDAAVRDGCVSLGASSSVEGVGLRDRARREQPAGNQRLQQRVFGGIESPPPTYRGTSRKGKSAGSKRGANRRAPDAGKKARTITRSNARPAQGDGRAIRKSARARCRNGAGAKRAVQRRTRRESRRPCRCLLAREKSGT